MPTSLPDSIVLLGGSGSEVMLTAEIVPGVKLEKGNILILSAFLQVVAVLI